MKPVLGNLLKMALHMRTGLKDHSRGSVLGLTLRCGMFPVQYNLYVAKDLILHGSIVNILY